MKKIITIEIEYKNEKNSINEYIHELQLLLEKHIIRMESMFEIKTKINNIWIGMRSDPF